MVSAWSGPEPYQGIVLKAPIPCFTPAVLLRKHKRSNQPTNLGQTNACWCPSSLAPTQAAQCFNVYVFHLFLSFCHQFSMCVGTSMSLFKISPPSNIVGRGMNVTVVLFSQLHSQYMKTCWFLSWQNWTKIIRSRWLHFKARAPTILEDAKGLNLVTRSTVLQS